MQPDWGRMAMQALPPAEASAFRTPAHAPETVDTCRYIRKRRFAIADPPCVRGSHPRSGSKYTCRCGCWGRDIYPPHRSARRDRSEGARPPPRGARAGGTGSEGPGRPGLVNWRIEQVSSRRARSDHIRFQPLLPPAAGRGHLPGRPAPATNWPTRPPLRQPGGLAPPCPRGPAGARRQPPTAGGPLRRAAGACPRWGRGHPARLPSSGLPLGPRRSRLVCAARPHTVRHAPPATAVDPSAADRWPGWSASLHTLRPLLGRAEVCSPSLAQKVLGGRRLCHTKWATLFVPEWQLRGLGARFTRRGRARRLEPAVAGASQATRGPSARPPAPTRASHRANWWVRPGTPGTQARGPPHGSARNLAPGRGPSSDLAACVLQPSTGGRRWTLVDGSWRQLGRTGCRVVEARLPCPRRRLASRPGVGTRAPKAQLSPAPLQAPGAAGALDGEVLTNKSSQGRADAQRLVATRLLDRVHDPLGHFSRLQRI